MKRIITSIILIISFFTLGCEEGNKKLPETSSSDSNRLNNQIDVNSYSVINASSTPKDLEKSVLDKAQKEYQDSYSEYVKSLRESGPQTIETLQALTLYQKKYQIYQMLLKAESEKH
jgi:hypothetical protein